MATTQSDTSSGLSTLFESAPAAESEAGAPREAETEESPEGEAEVDPAAGSEEGSEGQEGADGDEDESQDLDVEALIQQYAKEYGIDAADPKQRAYLKRLADKEVLIQQMKSGSGAKDTGKDYLAEYEKALDAPAAGGKSETAKSANAAEGMPKEAPPAAAGPPSIKYNDIGDAWKDHKDALTSYNEAWKDSDLDKVDQIEQAMFKRKMVALGIPLINAVVARALNEFQTKELGDVIPTVRRNVQERQESEARESAISALQSADEFKSVIPKLFEIEDGEDLEFQGKKFDNCALNRIFIQHPGLLRIKVDNADPAKAAKLTFYARYLEAAKIFKATQRQEISPKQAKEFVDSGVRIAEREHTTERARQSLNAGAGASGRQPPAKENYARSLQKMQGAGSLRDLFAD